MNVLRFDDPRAFAERTRAFLLEHEAENCFSLGHIPTLENPTDRLLVCVIDSTGEVTGVALMTPGRHMVMTRAAADSVVALMKYLHDQGISPPGIQGPREVAERFAREWERYTGKPGHSPVGMAIHRLDRVIPPSRPAPGTMRNAIAADLDLVTQWIRVFRRDIGESQLTDNREMAEQRVAAGEVVLWEDGGEPVAMAGATGQTPSGVRVVLVYTPAQFRKRGYASTLVATQSQRLLGAKVLFPLHGPGQSDVEQDLSRDWIFADRPERAIPLRVDTLPPMSAQSQKFSSPILPGSAVGVLGSGQLGRMFAIAARRMGYRVHTFSPDNDTPTGQVADVEITAAYDDLDAVRAFAKDVDVVTFEFENVPSKTTDAAAEFALVRPGGNVLHITQHRLREKTFLAENGFPVTPFRAVRNQADFDKALHELGTPGVLKTAGFGYDGKGQTKVTSIQGAADALHGAGSQEMIYEAFIDFDREVSLVAARGVDGSFEHWGLIDNTHRNHILDLSVCPAAVPEKVAMRAIDITRGVLEQLNVVGVLCVEFFLAKSGELMINELAPRPHNSGHLTFDASMTSQFEQQLRAVCGLPLGSTELLKPAAMVNLLGDLWDDGEPNWATACRFADVKLHLYGKQEARAGRKMGHLTALAKNPQQAARTVLAAREALIRKGASK